MMRLRLAVVVLMAVVGLAPVDLAAQARPIRLLGTVGLGRPLLPLDARARGMGSAAVSLHGGNFSAVNPAAAARITSPGVWVSLQQENRDLEGELASGDFSTADFPLIRGVLPLSERLVAGVAFAGALDQDWGVQFVDTLRLSSGDVAFQETRMSDGGIAEFRFELAAVASEKWALGIAGKLFSGEARQETEKAFASEADFAAFTSRAAFRYRGLGLTAGAEFQPIPEMIVGLVGTYGGTLNVENDSTGAEADVDLPVGLDVGASWQLTPDFILALAVGWENWSSAADDLPAGGATDVWRFGGGVELRALSNPSTDVFIRLGGHFDKQPFRLRGGAAWERAVSLGAGASFREGRGRLDAAVELGGRGDVEANQVSESFTRYTLSLAIFTG